MIKKLFVSLCGVCMMCIGVLVTDASTTGAVSPQLVFSSVLQTQKDVLLSVLYGQVTTLKTLYDGTMGAGDQKANYQILVCLGVFEQSNPRKVVEHEATVVKEQILNAVHDLETRFFALQNRMNLGLISDAEYTTQRSVLDAEASQLQAKYSTVIQNFGAKYTTYISDLQSEVQAYLFQNTQLIGGLREKMNAIHTTFDQYAVLRTAIFQYNNMKGGNDKIVQLFHTQKNVLGMMLDKQLQEISSRQVFADIPGMRSLLMTQKDAVVRLYMSDYEASINKAIGNWYDAVAYARIEDNIDVIKNTFYDGDVISCQKILTTSIDVPSFVANTQAQIKQMQKSVGATLSTLTTSAIAPEIIKVQLFNVFKQFYTERIKNDRFAFVQYAMEQQTRLQPESAVYRDETPTSTQPIITQDPVKQIVEKTKYPIDAKIRFTEPFARGYTGPQVTVLQRLLSNLGFYTGTINGIHNSRTVDAVYRFQLSQNILVGYENRPEVWGWMGPATRQALNTAILQQNTVE